MKYNTADIYFGSLVLNVDGNMQICRPESFIKITEEEYWAIKRKKLYYVFDEKNISNFAVGNIYPLIGCMEKPEDKMITSQTIKLYLLKFNLTSKSRKLLHPINKQYGFSKKLEK